MSSAWDYMSQNAKVKRGHAAERDKLVVELRERQGDLTHFTIAFAAGGRTAEQQAKIDAANAEIACIITRLDEITTPRPA